MQKEHLDLILCIEVYYLLLYVHTYALFQQAYIISPRTEWVKEWPGQVVLCASQVYWTREVHEAIRSGPQGLRDYWDRLEAQLHEVVALVRGKLSKQQRVTLGALVVIDVHARDVVFDMAEKGH